MAVCVDEHRTTLSQSVDVRSLHLWMTIEAANPVVLIIDGDEQNVGFLRGLNSGREEEHAETGKKWSH